MSDDKKTSSENEEIPSDLNDQIKKELGDTVNLKEYLVDIDAEYNVLLDRPDHLDLKVGTEVLCKVLGLHALDAKRLIRKGRGRFLEKLKRKYADRIVGALGRRGVKAFAISDYEMVHFPKKQRCVFVSADDNGVSVIHHMTMKRESFKWEDVFYMNVGMVPSDYFPRFIDSEDFAHMPIIQKVEDEELRAYYKEKLGEKAMTRQLHMRKAAHLESRKRTSSKEIDEQVVKAEALEDFQRKLEKATECFLDFIILNPTRYYRVKRSEVRLEYLPKRKRGEEREEGVNYVNDYVSAPDYLVHQIWEMFRRTPHLPVTHSTRNIIMFQPWRDSIFGAKDYYDEMYELFDRLIDPRGDIFHRIVGTPDMQDVYRKRDLPEQVLTGIEQHFKDEELKFEKLQRIMELLALNAPLLQTVYRDNPDFESFQEQTRNFLLKTTLREIFGSRMDEFKAYQEIAGTFVKHLSFDNLLYDNLEDYDVINQWYIQLKFEEFKRKALEDHAQA